MNLPRFKAGLPSPPKSNPKPQKKRKPRTWTASMKIRADAGPSQLVARFNWLNENWAIVPAAALNQLCREYAAARITELPARKSK